MADDNTEYCTTGEMADDNTEYCTTGEMADDNTEYCTTGEMADDNTEYCTAGEMADDNTEKRMRVACWIPEATNTHSEYVIIIAFSTATVVAQARLNVTL
jgi:hypothetical protein